MGYYTGTLSNQDDIVSALQAACVDAGWTIDRAGAVGTGNAAGLECLMHKGTNYVQLRSMVNRLGFNTSAATWLRGPWCCITGSSGYDSGADWYLQPGTSFEGSPNSPSSSRLAYVGMSPDSSAGQSASGLEFPCPYRIFTFTNPETIVMIIRATATKYQWIMFGSVQKFGTWGGGEFVAASNCYRDPGGGNYSSWPSLNIGGASRGRSYAPFHQTATAYNGGLTHNGMTNSTMRVLSGVGGAVNDWTYTGTTDPFGSSGNVKRWTGSANWLSDPINSRSPNLFNQVGVMSPFWIATQRDLEPNYTIIGRIENIRQIPLDNFNPEDTFTLGPDKWIMFPYFEKGGVTHRYGWAINANEVP